MRLNATVLVAALAAGLFGQSCKQPPLQNGASVASTPEEIRSYQKDALDCAKSALTGGLAKFVSALETANEAYEAINALVEETQAAQPAAANPEAPAPGPAPGDAPSTDPPAGDTPSLELTGEKPKCGLGPVKEAQKSLGELRTNLAAITGESGNTIEALKKVTETVQNAISLATSLNELAECGVAGAKVAKAAGKMTTHLATANVVGSIVQCGITVVNGVIMLGNDTYKAAQEVYEVRKQSQAVQAQAVAANAASKDEDRRYGTACEKSIRADSLTGYILRPLTDCSKCCGGEKFHPAGDTGYTACGERWKICMLACAETFGENNPRFFYSNSAVVDYRGSKCN